MWINVREREGEWHWLQCTLRVSGYNEGPSLCRMRLCAGLWGLLSVVSIRCLRLIFNERVRLHIYSCMRFIYFLCVHEV